MKGTLCARTNVVAYGGGSLPHGIIHGPDETEWAIHQGNRIGSRLIPPPPASFTCQAKSRVTEGEREMATTPPAQSQPTVADEYARQLHNGLVTLLANGAQRAPSPLGANNGGSGGGSGSNVCADYSSVLSDLSSSCVPGTSTQNFGKCAQTIGSIVGAPCGEVECLTAISRSVLGFTADEMCAEIDKGVQQLTSPDVAQRVGKLAPWFNTTLAPCVETMCSATSHPVSATSLRAAPKTFVRNALMSQLSGPERFALRYGWAIALAVLLGLIALIIGLWVHASSLSRRLRLCNALGISTTTTTA